MAGHLTGRVALVLEYEGTKYAGWQYQANADTVQNQMEQALKALFQEKVQIRGASRTDSGVHARGQVAAFDLPRPFPLGKLAGAINWHLPGDIKVVKAYQVPADFHPIVWATGKIYTYSICNRPQPSALGSRFLWHQPKPLDLGAMNNAARHCLGTHDFASFQAAGSEVVNTVRTIRHLYCRRRGDLLTITCIGDGFLYNMVRIITGTLIEAGLGRLNPSGMTEIIAARTREAAGPTAPAQGLVLERVLYRPSLDSYRPL